MVNIMMRSVMVHDDYCFCSWISIWL